MIFKRILHQMATRELAHAQIKHQLQNICDMVSKKGLVLK